MIKFRWYCDVDKEAWLNKMAQRGYAMTKCMLGFYSFEPCKPGEYIYRIDLFTEEKRRMSQTEYVNLIRECGAEYICKWGRWRFFRRPAELGDFELYTDMESRIEQLSRVYRFILGLWSFEIALFINTLLMNVISFYNRSSAFAPQISVVNFVSLMLMAVVVAAIGSVWYRMRKRIKKLKCQLI